MNGNLTGHTGKLMGIDAPALSRLQTGKMLNPTLATLHKWAEALGRRLDVDLSPA
jgi:transcriptional regulator with XRE-family HTH domain